MTRVSCPECDAVVTVSKGAGIGQKVTCPSCGAFLEIIETSPVELDWATEDEDEYEDEDDFYEDDDDDEDW